MILDSCFLIDLMAGDEGAIAKLDELTENASPMALSAITVTEVGIGLGGDAEREAFDRLVDRMTVVPFDHRTGRRAARIQRELYRDGRPIGALDLLIAATAVERGEPVVTRNVTEFTRVPDCSVSPY